MTKKIIVSNIEIDINRKNIKNMYLRVSGHDGRVSISNQLRMKNEEIIKFVTNKIQWIEKQKRKFENSTIQYKYDYVDGEIHYLWGKPYVLRIVTGSKCRTDIIDDS